MRSRSGALLDSKPDTAELEYEIVKLGPFRLVYFIFEVKQSSKNDSLVHF